VAKSDNPRARRAHEAERARAAEAAREAEFRRRTRRQRMIGIGVVVAVVLAVVGVVYAATGQKGTKAASSAPTSTLDQLPTTTAPAGNPNPPASLPAVAPGAALTGATPCPAADGSSARVTKFASAPPMCIDPKGSYGATIHTSKGDMTVELEASVAPNSVNNFIVLARYHYYDGLPITRVVPRGWAEVGDPKNADGTTGPGYTVAGETQPQGSVATPVILAMIPDSTGASGGGFIFGIADQVAGMPPKATQIGQIMDSRIDKTKDDLSDTVQQAINKIGTKTGEPAEVVTITGVTVDAQPNGH
jgi:cyclophilin family peptidyl-prolyl cis-trans isomerase